MATEQEAIKFYVPRDEAAEFKRLLREQDKTISAVLRRAIREYVAKQKAAA